MTTERDLAALEPRTRMLEEIVRGQDKQLAMLVANDERRMAVDQQNAIVMARLADALSNVREDMSQNRTLIMDKVDERFKALSAQVDGLHGEQLGHAKTLGDHGLTLAEHGNALKSLKEAADGHDRAIGGPGGLAEKVAGHANAFRVICWVGGALWAIVTALIVTLASHWLAPSK